MSSHPSKRGVEAAVCLTHAKLQVREMKKKERKRERDRKRKGLFFLGSMSAASLLLLLQDAWSFVHPPSIHMDACRRSNLIQCRAIAPDLGNPSSYANHWETLLTQEYRETAAQLRERRAKWSRKRLEANGLGLFDASATPESDLFGEKVVRVSKSGASQLADRFSRGDILIISPDDRAPPWSTAAKAFVPRECCVVNTGKDWITVGVGRSWPAGLWEARRRPGSFAVTLQRTAPQAPLKAQRDALSLAHKGSAGDAVALLASDAATMPDAASALPPRFVHAPSTLSADAVRVDGDIRKAIREAKRAAHAFQPNDSQEAAVAWALRRRLSLIRGPPGTGKTRTAAFLISSAMRLQSHHHRPTDSGAPSPSPPGKILAVAHSNGAADVLLAALLGMGVPAVRVGRPASVSPSVRRRTVVALAEKHPEIVALSARARNASLPPHQRSAASVEIGAVREEVSKAILRAAQVVVCSCIGAHQLLDEGLTFPMAVLDEGSQATEPALVCALAAAKAEQLVIVGDTRQLPPTVTSESLKLRQSLGMSPMARLERAGIGQRTLRVQYRMPPELLEHPSAYFYNSLVTCANERRARPPPKGFAWPRGLPLCFIDYGHDLEVSHDSGGKSNPDEADLVAKIALEALAAGDVSASDVAVITPYASQVDRIRRSLSGACRVGTVDSFQGQETDLVIFSATRSNGVGDLGFLRDPRRLCVAITRAKRGLVLVGDVRTLRNSHHWSALIESCRSRGCLIDAQELLASAEAKDDDEVTQPMTPVT